MKKWFLRLTLGVLAMFALLFAFVFLRSTLPATVLDKDLKLERRNLPAGANAYDQLQTAARQIWWPEEQSAGIGALVSNTHWAPALATTVLAKNQAALAAWDAAAQLPDLQVPEITQFGALMPYLQDWKKLSQLAQVRENFLLHNGQAVAGFDQIVQHIQIGQRLQNSQSLLIGYLVGTAVHSMGLSQMQRWVGKTQLTPLQLTDYIRRIEPPSDQASTAFAKAIKSEYQCLTGTLEALRSGRLVDTETGDNYPRLPRFLPVYNASQTRSLFAENALRLVKAAPRHYNEAKLPDFETHRPGMVSLILSGNLSGQVLFYMTWPAVSGSLTKKCQADVQLQATRTILALRAYQLTHGQLPADLNALVPEFLAAVPVDDFDGQPLRYSAEKKIVYSVGKDLKDDGGDDRSSETSSAQRHLDFAYHFDF